MSSTGLIGVVTCGQALVADDIFVMTKENQTDDHFSPTREIINTPTLMACVLNCLATPKRYKLIYSSPTAICLLSTCDAGLRSM